MTYKIKIKPHNREKVDGDINIPEGSCELYILIPGMKNEEDEDIYELISQELNSNGISTMKVDILGLDAIDNEQDEMINSYYLLSSDLKALVKTMKNITREDIFEGTELSLENEYVTNVPIFKIVKLVCMDLMSRCAIQGSFIKDENVETILVEPLLKDGSSQFELLCGKRGIYEKIAKRYKSCPIELYTKNGKVTKMFGLNFYNELSESKPLERLDQNSQNLIHIYCTEKEAQEPEIKSLSSKKTIIQETDKGNISFKSLIPELIKSMTRTHLASEVTNDNSRLQKEQTKTITNTLKENEILNILYNEHTETKQVQQKEYTQSR